MESKNHFVALFDSFTSNKEEKSHKIQFSGQNYNEKVARNFAETEAIRFFRRNDISDITVNLLELKNNLTESETKDYMS